MICIREKQKFQMNPELERRMNKIGHFDPGNLH